MFEAIHSSRTLPNPRTAIVSVTVRFRALTIIGESSASGSTSNLVVLGWLSLICWSGDLNSHQAFKAQGIGGAESSKERGVGFSGRYAALKDNRGATMGILSLPILVAWYVAPQSTERSNTCRT